MKRTSLHFILFTFIIAIILPTLEVKAQEDKPNAGLLLPDKFSATLVADNVGRARHLVVTPQNDIYVRLARLKDGKGTVMLHEQDGKATEKTSFGDFGGTGIYLRDGYLYTSSNEEIFRYKVDKNNHVISPDAPETIVTGLLNKGTHNTKSIMMDNNGNLFIPIGCPLNSCQEEDRKKGSMGIPGCPLLNISGGVWQFRSDKLNQTLDDGIRYATGLRNVVAVDWNQQSDQLYVVQHGRDNLNSIFPDLYTVKESAELPAEAMYALKKGDNAGWPYAYYDGFQKKNILAPEYGGDGKIAASSDFLNPAVAFPAHMAPNGLLFYSGNQFPERYKNGAFIAFHGSWNRAPEPQAGYFVVFQPFKDGKPVGDWEVFADGFSGSPEKTAAGKADRRPCGLAQGPDGSLYVTDDVKGGIFKITYNAKADAKQIVAPKPAVSTKPVSASSAASNKTTTVNKTTAAASSIPTATIAAGKVIYSQYCVACHQLEATGISGMIPPLVKTKNVLGAKPVLINTLLKGMSGKEINGETYSGVMPPFNFLTDEQIANVLTFVRNNFGNKASAITVAEVKTERNKK